MTAEPMTRPDPGATPPRRVPWPAVGVFVATAWGLAWLVALPLWLGDGLASPPAAVLVPAMMWTPAVAAVIVTFVMRVPRSQRLRFLGVRPLRPAGRLVLFLAIALMLPILVVALTIVLAAAFGLVTLDLVDFSGFAEQLAATVPPGTALPPVALLVAFQLASIPMGALLNSVFALGEELGWRGWLQQALLPLGVWPALLLTGVVWGLWHAPVILLGYNFARPDLTGLLLMVGGCVAWGVLLGWLRLRSASVWPAVLAHGSLNAVGALVLLVAAAGSEPDLAVVGPLGAIAWAVLAVVAVAIVLLGQFRAGVPAPARTFPDTAVEAAR